MIDSVIGSGLAGMQRGLVKIEQSADAIARANIPSADGSTEDLAQPLLQQLDGETQVKASARVVAVADASLGALIDIRV